MTCLQSRIGYCNWRYTGCLAYGYTDGIVCDVLYDICVSNASDSCCVQWQ